VAYIPGILVWIVYPLTFWTLVWWLLAR